VLREDHLVIGAKALLDALKVCTTGRRDRRLLHYFGAIADDSLGHVSIHWEQHLVDHPKDARTRIEVFPFK
jgi:hypothetical protein